jgi:hypothetical protein
MQNGYKKSQNLMPISNPNEFFDFYYCVKRFWAYNIFGSTFFHFFQSIRTRCFAFYDTQIEFLQQKNLFAYISTALKSEQRTKRPKNENLRITFFIHIRSGKHHFVKKGQIVVTFGTFLYIKYSHRPPCIYNLVFLVADDM